MYHYKVKEKFLLKVSRYGKQKDAIKLEIFTLWKMKGISWIVLISYVIAIVMFLLSFDIIMMDMDSNSFFFFQQMALCILKILGFVPIIMGSKVIWDDMGSGILQLKNSVYGRKFVFLSKVIAVIIFQLLFSLIPCLTALIYDYQYGNKGQYLSVIKIFSIVQLFGTIWCLLSMAITYLFKSSFGATGILICIYYLEAFFVQYIPNGIAKWLPIWNENSILHRYFPKAEGMIAIVQRDYNTGLFSYGAILGIFSIAFISYLYQYLKKDM